MGDLIDTTEMYLKTVYELEEDGVTPLRARIVERLGHSGPTVSQTVARMERDGLVHVLGDRRLELTPEGHDRAVEVMRKHRLAERLLLDVVGLEWAEVHEEACRWEHVMSDQVEGRLVDLLEGPTVDPYGNAIPGSSGKLSGLSAERALHDTDSVDAVLVRIGEPIQADLDLIRAVDQAGVRPGEPVRVSTIGDEFSVTPLEVDGEPAGSAERVVIPGSLAAHLFLEDAH